MDNDTIKDILRNAQKYRADPETVLADLNQLYLQASQGFQDFRTTSRGDVVSLVAKDLKVALEAKRTTWQVISELQEMVKDEESTPALEIRILPLEVD